MKFEIDGDVLKRCELEEGETTAVVPEGVKAIGEKAFWNRSSLESVVIPEGVTVIGAGAFEDCKNLKSIVIPEGVT
ncbi:MAG TPA: leucine-rich repeat domain-containing protein, partial [Candidatus Pullichristensenella stercorigallinarum]|nr:leucine-rich repeat domain-containing protein [Candidatus Pullichristensenella stercorigallinarum]